MNRYRSRLRGFSLLEVVAVLLLVGILAAVVVSRADPGDAFRELGYIERVVGDLRLAGQRAGADRCPVRVAVSASEILIRQRASLCAGSFSRQVPSGAAGAAWLGGPTPEGVPVSASPGVFYFDGYGRVLDAPAGSAVDVVMTVGQRQIDVTGATAHVSY